MADTNEVAARGDYSIADLRGMMAGEKPAEKAAETSEKAVPVEGEADEADPTETEPASGTDKRKQDNEKARGEDGKFKAADKDESDDDSPGVKKRIGKVLQRQREAEARALDLERELAALKGSQPATGDKAGKPAQQQQTAAKAKPELKDFETYESFNEALVEWKVEQRETAREQQQRAAAQKAATEAVLKEHFERVKATREQYEDFDEKLASLNVPISRELDQAIKESELGPEVVYYVANHPEEGKRISALSPARQVVEFGKLEAKVEALKNPAGTKPQAQDRKPLPKPPANVGGSAGAKQPDLNDRKLSLSEFKRLAQASLRRR